jgi:hypothetical protein
LGARGGTVLWGTALQAGSSQVRFLMSLEFFRLLYNPEFDSASNRNEYQEYFLRGKGGRCVGLTTLPPSCADCLEIWEPQPPGTLKDWIGLNRDCFFVTTCYLLWSWLLYVIFIHKLNVFICEVMAVDCWNQLLLSGIYNPTWPSSSLSSHHIRHTVNTSIQL